VELDDRHIEALAVAYPPPRYYADPEQMRDSVRRGIMFKVIDVECGEKADLIPLTMASRYREAFQRRVRHTVDLPDCAPFAVWCARPEDVIVGKLLAWAEGRSAKHETDIYEMLVARYAGLDQESALDEEYVSAHACWLGAEARDLWESLRGEACRQAERS